MAKHDQIDLAGYRQPAAEAYADDVVDPGGNGLFTADYVNELIRAAYLAGVTSVAPESVTARYEYSQETTLHGGEVTRTGRYRQRTRAITEARKTSNRIIMYGHIQHVKPVRRVVIEGDWEEI